MVISISAPNFGGGSVAVDGCSLCHESCQVMVLTLSYKNLISSNN